MLITHHRLNLFLTRTSSARSDPSAGDGSNSYNVTSVMTTIRRVNNIANLLASGTQIGLGLSSLANKELVKTETGYWFVRKRSYRDVRIINILDQVFAEFPQQDRPTTTELFAHVLSKVNPTSASIGEVKVEEKEEQYSPNTDETLVEDHTLEEYLLAAEAAARIDAQGPSRPAPDGTTPPAIV